MLPLFCVNVAIVSDTVCNVDVIRKCFSALCTNNAAIAWQKLLHPASCYYAGPNNAASSWQVLIWCTQAAATKSKQKAAYCNIFILIR